MSYIIKAYLKVIKHLKSIQRVIVIF